MANLARMEVYQAILEIGVVPLFYQAELDTAASIVSACVGGGARVVEFTNRGASAFPVFSELARRFQGSGVNAILGVGSIVDAPTAALYIASGANFIVGPSFNAEIARLCNRRKVAYIPGCATETEISLAEEWGAEICKIFPRSVGGPEFIRAVMAPCPWHRLLPTGGVDATEENVTAWIRAGAAAVGLGSRLIPSGMLKSDDLETLAGKVAQIRGWILKARAQAAV